MLERSSDNILKAWYRKKRRKPLVIRGARQVGKSTLVRRFARDNGLILNEINLEQHLYLDKIFKTLDLTDIRINMKSIFNIDHNGQGHCITGACPVHRPGGLQANHIGRRRISILQKTVVIFLVFGTGDPRHHWDQNQDQTACENNAFHISDF